MLRMAAATYEGVLLFGVLFVVAYPLLSITRWDDVLTGGRRALFQGVLFVVLGVYFVYQWHRTGQTLAMKSWHVRLLDETGAPPSVKRCMVRYLTAWHPLVPAALCKALGAHTGVVAGAMAAGVVLSLLAGAADPKRRLLHDRLSKTCVMRER